MILGLLKITFYMFIRHVKMKNTYRIHKFIYSTLFNSLWELNNVLSMEK